MGVINRGDIFAGDSSDVWEIGFPVTAEGVRPVELAELDNNFSCSLSIKDSKSSASAQRNSQRK